MAHEVEVTLTSAKDLKNINWKNGPIKPYVVLWVDQGRKVTSRVDDEGDTDPKWNQTLIVPLNCSIRDATLYFEVVHHASCDEDDIKPLIGSAKLDLQNVVDDIGIGCLDSRSIKLKRPSGRPHGKLKLDIVIREAQSYGYGSQGYGSQGGGYSSSPYGQSGYGDSREAPSYGQQPYGGQQPPAHYGESTPYADQGYGGQPPQGYPAGQPVQEEEKKKEGLGLGAGIAIGAAAGVVGGVALYAGYNYLTKSDDEEEDEEKERAVDEDEGEDEDEEDEDDD